MPDFDVIVIGGGSAGTAAARAASLAGARTAMINDGELGGLCILRGCMPTKAMLASAHAMHEATHMDPLGIRLEGRVEQVQMLGRLLSTRHKEVELTGRGRVLLPEGFRQFLTAKPGDEVFVVGAAVCIEIWRPESWVEYLNQQMPEFRQLLDNLSG